MAVDYEHNRDHSICCRSYSSSTISTKTNLWAIWCRNLCFPCQLFHLIFPNNPLRLYKVPDELLIINYVLANTRRFRVTAAFWAEPIHLRQRSYSAVATRRWIPTTPALGSHGNQRSAKKTWWVVNSGALCATFIIPFFSPQKYYTHRFTHWSGGTINLRFRVPSRTDSPANLSGPVEQILYPHKF